MAQRSVRKMLGRQAKLTGRPATAKARGLGSSKANASVRAKTGISRSGPLGRPKSPAKPVVKRPTATTSAVRVKTGGANPTFKQNNLAKTGNVVKRARSRIKMARTGAVKKQVQKNPQRSVASMRATQRRLRKG